MSILEKNKLSFIGGVFFLFFFFFVDKPCLNPFGKYLLYICIFIRVRVCTCVSVYVCVRLWECVCVCVTSDICSLLQALLFWVLGRKYPSVPHSKTPYCLPFHYLSTPHPTFATLIARSISDHYSLLEQLQRFMSRATVRFTWPPLPKGWFRPSLYRHSGHPAPKAF